MLKVKKDNDAARSLHEAEGFDHSSRYDPYLIGLRFWISLKTGR